MDGHAAAALDPQLLQPACKAAGQIKQGLVIYCGVNEGIIEILDHAAEDHGGVTWVPLGGCGQVVDDGLTGISISPGTLSS